MLGTGGALAVAGPAAGEIRVLEHRTIYSDRAFHSAFPSIVRRTDGELLVAFRRAPDRRRFGAKHWTHTDPNSYLVLTRSRDLGVSWTQPEVFFAHEFGGSQDPCLLQLADETLLCASYAWAWMPPGTTGLLDNSVAKNGDYAFLGGFLLRSEDGGRSWGRRFSPPSIQAEARRDLFNAPLSSYNRGAMLQGMDGRIFWVIATSPAADGVTENHLLVSADNGSNWEYASLVARDEVVAFNETSLYETPGGDLVAFMRTANFDGRMAVARSRDGGRSFQPWADTGFQGHPAHALRLPDNRVLLVYGYRHEPYGIRARILNAECTDITTAPEIVLRNDGGGVDLGYPWSALIDQHRVIVVYYFNQHDGPRGIEATVLETGVEP